MRAVLTSDARSGILPPGTIKGTPRTWKWRLEPADSSKLLRRQARPPATPPANAQSRWQKYSDAATPCGPAAAPTRPGEVPAMAIMLAMDM